MLKIMFLILICEVEAITFWYNNISFLSDFILFRQAWKEDSIILKVLKLYIIRPKIQF